MTTFFKKSKKNYLGAILGLFCPCLGKNELSLKKGFCHFLDIPIIYHCVKSQKKLMSYFWEKRRTDGRTDRQTHRLTERQTDNSDFIGPSVGQGSNKCSSLTNFIKTNHARQRVQPTTKIASARPCPLQLKRKSPSASLSSTKMFHRLKLFCNFLNPIMLKGGWGWGVPVYPANIWKVH